MRRIEAIRCLLFAGLTASGPWLSQQATLGGVPAPLAWTAVVLALAACFAWIVRADLRRHAAQNPEPDDAWPGGAEQREA